MVLQQSCEQHVVYAECKQMRFRLPFESVGISKFLEGEWQIIPCFQSSIRKALLAELALQ